jgi:hypothetical protein
MSERLTDAPRTPWKPACPRRSIRQRERAKLRRVSDVRRDQAAFCQGLSVLPVFVADDDKVGVALNVRDPQLWPLNGLRHPPEPGTSGWYLWAGQELGAGDDFFQPLHAKHIRDWRPELLPYLALPAGWRFLIASGHQAVWYDESLLAPAG